jgi:glycosyltransferase involved in cell wall biosynthesis
VTVIPNASRREGFQLRRARRALKAGLGLAGKTVLGFVGSFYAYEGLDLLLDAFPACSAATRSARAAGRGWPQDANLKAQAQRLGVADKVIFTGRVPHAQVSRYYDLIDLLVYPRHSMRLTELVTPLKPWKPWPRAHLCRLQRGRSPGLIRDGETGRLFAAGDAARSPPP